ncbi:hypothetical protein ACSHWO_07040 [Streptomyces sp. HUAS TT3]|uniref:hypothetical protein n=1 Tax=Streptomyces sp. HUAS TT3 TaxID=3447510 RepID=UPI003F65C9B6
MSEGRLEGAAGPALVVGRLSATLRYGPGEAPPAADRLRGPLRHAVDGHLAAALRALALPPGRWCLARLDLTLPLDLDRPDPALARDWSRAVAAAIERTVREDRGAAVHYRSDSDLLADAVTGIATRRLERLWAWRQTGLVHPDDPAPGAAPGGAVLAVLERHPRQAAATVLRAAERCGVAPLDRALGRRGWQRLAALATDNVPSPPGGPAPDPATRALARTLWGGSRFAALVRAARLRPAEPTAAAWAVLVLAETDPAALHRPGARPGLHRLFAEALGAPDGLPTGFDAEPRPPAAASGPESEREAPTRPSPAEPAGREALPPAPYGEAGDAPRPEAPDVVGPGLRSPAPDTSAERAPVRASGPVDLQGAQTRREPAPGPAAEPSPSAEGGLPTDWAGLPFLLATAAEAGLPDRVLDDPALAARPLCWVLHAVARALVPAAPVDDPAALALAGLDRARAARVLAADPPTPAERARIDALAAAWARSTATRLTATAERPTPVAAAAPAPATPAEPPVPLHDASTPSASALGLPASPPAADPAATGPTPDAVAPAPLPDPVASGVAEPSVPPAASGAAGSAWASVPAVGPGGAGRALVSGVAGGQAEPVVVGADALGVVGFVARRRGRVVAEAGWIEVVLAAGDADPRLRRAGLDLDPGWVGWLGAVVRYRYV